MRDLFALCTLFPPLRALALALNRCLRRFELHEPPVGAQVIGQPHTDSARAITCLGGDRERMLTEILDETGWAPLSFETDSIYIMPSDQCRAHDLEPTIHRYAIRHDEAGAERQRTSTNATLLIGIVDLPRTASSLSH